MKDGRTLVIFLLIFWIDFGATIQQKPAQGIRNMRPLPPVAPRRVVRQEAPLLRVNEIQTQTPPEGLIPVKKIGNKFYTYEPLFGAAGSASEQKQNGLLYPVPEHILRQFSVLKRTKGVMEEVQAASETRGAFVSQQQQQSTGSGGYTQSQSGSGGYGGYSEAAAAPATAAPSRGYVYNPPPPVAETMEELAPVQQDVEEDIPVENEPVADFVTSTLPPPEIETEEDNLADSISPGPVDIPVRDTPDFEINKPECHDDGSDPNAWPCGYGGVISGREGIDYPIYSSIPRTSFDCRKQAYSGYYADIEARCQSFHVCLRRSQFRRIEKWSFLCPNGTVFSQEDFACVWWDMAPPCDQETRNLYERNERIGWDNTDDQSIKGFMTAMVRSQLKPAAIATATAPTPSVKVRPQPTLPMTAVRTGFPRPLPTPTRPKITSVEMHTEYELQSRSKTRTGSAVLKSESEGYEEKSAPNALEEEIEPPKVFIVNRQEAVTTTTSPPEENFDYDPIPDPDQMYLQDTPSVPTVVMMPIAQQFPDGTERVSNVPVVVMMTTPRPAPKVKVTFQPVGVNNPHGTTIPNRPERPGGYGYPTNPSAAYGVPALAPAPKPTYLPPKQVTPEVEYEQNIDSDYQSPAPQIPESRPVIDYELPVQMEAPNRKYLPPARPQPPRNDMSASPSNIYGPPRKNSVGTQRNVAAAAAQKTSAATAAPVQIKRPATKKQIPRPALATDNEAVNQILGSSGVTDSITDGEVFSFFSRPQVAGGAAGATARPQPRLNITAQPISDNLGTRSQLYNANVRELYRQKSGTERDERQGAASFDTFARSKPIAGVVRHPSDSKEKGGRDLPVNLAKLDVPVGAEEQVRAFLTSQEDLDPNQIMEVRHFDKYALFVPENGTKSAAPAVSTRSQQSSAKKSSGATRPTAKSNANANNGGYPTSSSSAKGSATSAQKPKQAQTPPPQKPSDEYGTPNKEFDGSDSARTEDQGSNELPVKNLEALPETFLGLSAQIYAPIQSQTYVPVLQPFNQPGPQIFLQQVGPGQPQTLQIQQPQDYSNQNAPIPSALPRIVEQILQIQTPEQPRAVTEQFQQQGGQQQEAQPQQQQQQQQQQFVPQQQQFIQQPQQLQFIQQQQPQQFILMQQIPLQSQQQQPQQQQFVQIQTQPQLAPPPQEPQQQQQQSYQFIPDDKKPEVFRAQEIDVPGAQAQLERQPLFGQQNQAQGQQQQQQPQLPLPPIGQTGFFALPQTQFQQDLGNHIQQTLAAGAQQFQDQLTYGSQQEQQIQIAQPLFPPTFDILGSTLEKPDIIPALAIHESSSVGQLQLQNQLRRPTATSAIVGSYDFGGSGGGGYNADKNPQTYQLQSSASSQSQTFLPAYPQTPVGHNRQRPFVRTHYNKNTADRQRLGQERHHTARQDTILGSGSAQVPVQILAPQNRPVTVEKFTHAEGIRTSRNANLPVVPVPRIPVHNSHTQKEQSVRALY